MPKHFQGQVAHKYTRHDIQNELLYIMASNVLRVKVSFQSWLMKEWTPVILNNCPVDDNLDVSEDFIGFYELDNVKNETIINAIKDILLRFHLNLDDCHDQAYGGASNMLEKRSRVSTQIHTEQPKAMATHCLEHFVSLAIKLLTKNYTILRDTISTVGKICVA